MIEAGLPVPELQTRYRLPSGRTAICDYDWDGSVVAEFDGFGKYRREMRKPDQPADDVVIAEKLREDELRARSARGAVDDRTLGVRADGAAAATAAVAVRDPPRGIADARLGDETPVPDGGSVAGRRDVRRRSARRPSPVRGVGRRRTCGRRRGRDGARA
ncbi:hypothetical protein GCM10009855_02470 [Gordonia cholesterolivorans]|uniref:Uncharacterized protein n=1 Tax=Gordonia cholesterolivorans TaxID=559625 RepID=A0ABN3H1E0_9ACTN